MKENRNLHPTKCGKTDCFAYVFKHGQPFCFVLSRRDTYYVASGVREILPMCGKRGETCKFYKPYTEHELFYPDDEAGEVVMMREKGEMH